MADTKRTFLVLAIWLAGGCAAAPDADDDLSEPAVAALHGSCGRPPPPQDCATPTCTEDNAWEYDPDPPGTPCRTSGHCDGAGTCIVSLPINPPPRNLIVHQSTPHEYLIEWTCGANANYHQLYWNVNGGAFGAWFGGPQAGCPGGGSGVFDDFIYPGYQYCFYVSAWNDTYGANTGVVCPPILFDTTPPAAPTGNVYPTRLGGQLVFHDQASNENGYRAYMRGGGAGPWTLLRDFSNPAPYLTRPDEVYPDSSACANRSPCGDFVVTVPNLDPAISYEFKVQAYHDNLPAMTEVVFPAFHPLPPLTGAWSADQQVSDNRSRYGGAVATLFDAVFLVHQGYNASGDDTSLWASVYSNGAWNSNQPIANQGSREPPTIAAFNGQLYMMHTGADDNTVWISRHDNATNTWLPNTALPFQSTVSPVMAALGDKLYVVGITPGTWHRLWLATMSTSEVFTTPAPLASGWYTSYRDPSLTVHQRGSEPPTLWLAFVDGQDHHSLRVGHTTPSGDWTIPLTIGQDSRGAPALGSYQGTLHMIYQGGHSDVVWSYLDGDTWTAPVLLPQMATYNGQPSLTALSDRLVMTHQSAGDAPHDPECLYILCNPFETGDYSIYYTSFR